MRRDHPIFPNERYPNRAHAKQPHQPQRRPLWPRMLLSSEYEEAHPPVPLCPTFFPPHRNARKRARSETFSEFWVATAENSKLAIPNKLIVRNYTDYYSNDRALPDQFLVDNVINPALVIVLGVKNDCGMTRYAWFKRNPRSRNHLQRMDPLEIGELWAEMEKCPHLRESSLCNELLDTSLSCSGRWRTTANNVNQMVLKSCRSALRNYKKHRDMHSTLQEVFRLPEESTLPTGNCHVCMKDGDVALHHTKCWGEAGAVCTDCLTELKHLCPICDRKFFNATYSCAGCQEELPFKDFGFPCVDCHKCTLCEDCHIASESCQKCRCRRNDRNSR